MREVGEDIIKVITNKRPIDVSLLVQRPFIEQRTYPLEHFLVNVVHGERRRTSTRNDEWATEQVTFEVK